MAVYGTLVVRAHEGTHNVPWGDLTKACLVAGNEVQRVDLTSFDTDGDSFVLTQNGQNTIPIVRGANNTTAGISAALQGGNEQQQVLLTGYDNNGDSFTLTHGANTSPAFVRGTNYTQAAIQTALQGTAEVQTVSLSNYTVDGREYRLTYNGNQTTPIVRGQNNTAAGIQNALQGGNDVQVVTLTGFNPAVNNFRLRFTGSANISSVIGTGGVTYDTANVQNAINAITGFAGGATVSALTNAGFTVTFSGASANVNAAALQVVECNNGLDACVYANRESARGGTAMTGWPALGTVAVGTVTDAGYTLTFSGAHQGTNVSALTVTSGTGGVTGAVAETTAGTAGILPAGTQAALGTPNDAGFTVTFSPTGAAANTDVGPLTVTNPVDTGGAAAVQRHRSARPSRAPPSRPGWTVGGTARLLRSPTPASPPPSHLRRHARCDRRRSALTVTNRPATWQERCRSGSRAPPASTSAASPSSTSAIRTIPRCRSAQFRCAGTRTRSRSTWTPSRTSSSSSEPAAAAPPSRTGA